MNYVRLCKTTNTKGTLVPVETLNINKIKDIIKENPDIDWYTSIYQYNEEVNNYFKDNNNSIAGYNGKALSNKLVFDFDDKNDPRKAREDGLILLKRLKDEGIDVKNNALVYFSGFKGFHIELPLDKELEPDELKTICQTFAEKYNLQSFDPSIYNVTRLFRLPNTKHQVSGLYKISLEPVEFGKLKLDEIKKLAKQPRFIDFHPKTNSFELINGICDEYNKTKLNLNKNNIIQFQGGKDDVRGLDKISFSKCPKHIPRCIFALEHGIMLPGERSRLFFRLARYYENQGKPKEIAYRALKGVSEQNHKLYPEYNAIDKDEIWNQHINSAYTNSNAFKHMTGATGVSKDNELVKNYCSIISDYTDKKCSLHSEITESKSVIKIDDIFDGFSKFAEGYKQNRIETGIHFIDENMYFAAGTTTLIAGSAGSGKTTISLNILENASKRGIKSVFFSLDMHRNLVLLKLAKKLTNYDQEEIIDFYRNKDEVKKKEISDKIKLYYNNVFFDFTGTLSMDDMKEKINTINQQLDEPIKLVIVDYASRIAGPFNDRYANSTYNALRSKDVADETDAAWVILSQVSRSTGDGMNPIRTKRAPKESGDWEESATNVITLWRPFLSIEGKDDIMRLFLAKNRMGKELERPLKWDGEKGIIEDMTDDEYNDYVEMREEDEKVVLRERMGIKK